MIPDMTTGMRDFMMRSGLNVPRPAIPIPDLEVPYAAPIATQHKQEEAIIVSVR